MIESTKPGMELAAVVGVTVSALTYLPSKKNAPNVYTNQEFQTIKVQSLVDSNNSRVVPQPFSPYSPVQRLQTLFG